MPKKLKMFSLKYIKVLELKKKPKPFKIKVQNIKKIIWKF